MADAYGSVAQYRERVAGLKGADGSPASSVFCQNCVGSERPCPGCSAEMKPWRERNGQLLGVTFVKHTVPVRKLVQTENVARAAAEHEA